MFDRLFCRRYSQQTSGPASQLAVQPAVQHSAAKAALQRSISFVVSLQKTYDSAVAWTTFHNSSVSLWNFRPCQAGHSAPSRRPFPSPSQSNCAACPSPQCPSHHRVAYPHSPIVLSTFHSLSPFTNSRVAPSSLVQLRQPRKKKPRLLGRAGGCLKCAWWICGNPPPPWRLIV